MRSRTARIEGSARRQALLDAMLKEEGLHAAQPQAIAPRGSGVSGRVVLSFGQQRLWFLDQLVPGSAAYNIHQALRLGVALDEVVLGRCLNEIVARHEALRTVFVAVDGEPAQVVVPGLEVVVGVVDLCGAPVGERERLALEVATREARQPFDLARGPLLRAKLVRLGERDCLFLVTMHHIVSDGWSMVVFADELTALYEAFVAGRPSPLEPLAVQYPDFAVWQREWLAGERLAEQLAYWRERLVGAPVLGLPTDRPRPAVQTFAGAQHPVALPGGLVEGLRGLARGEGATLFMVLLAGFA
jgi:hypothetical protein